MLNFCTLFNFNYLARGLAMYRSLEQFSPAFHLFVFAFDNECYAYLKGNPLPHLTAISLADFESPDLLSVKPTRSMAEYCWTSTPFTISYCLQTFQLESCTYLDADMIFYHNPQPLIDEMGEKSVLISRHRYPRLYDQSWYSGIYCVQFMCFKNTPGGWEVLNWWKERCLEWCYARLEDGKFGDQKYLDDWPQRFSSVHVMAHPGGGVAPWNLELYDFQFPAQGESPIEVRFKRDVRWAPLIFFHYHGLKFFKDEKVLLAGPLYPIDDVIKSRIYFPYVKNLLALADKIRSHDPAANPNGASGTAPAKQALFKQFVKDLINSFARYFPGAFVAKNYNFKKRWNVYAGRELWALGFGLWALGCGLLKLKSFILI